MVDFMLKRNAAACAISSHERSAISTHCLRIEHGVSKRPAPMALWVGKTTLQIAKEGERDSERLSERVIRLYRVNPRQLPSVGGLSIDKNVTVVESWFYTAAESTDYGSVSTDRDSARLAINAAQEKPLGTI